MARCPKCNTAHTGEERTCPADGEVLRRDADMRTQAGRLNTPRRAPAGRADALPSLAEGEVAPSLADIAFDEGLKTGSQVGEYTVTGKIGEGGMGTVYSGIHPLIGKKVAIKLLNLGLSQDPTIVQRFVQEARAVNQIGHRNIIDIFSFGQLPNGRHYYVMDFLAGRSLKKRLDADPPLAYAEVLTVLLEVCDALSAAHAEGIIHRDLKPDNIYLVESKSGEHTVKLLDFGIAKLLRRADDAGQTRTGAPLGTPYYMSPEQCRSKPIDARADIYAMGVIMFEAFTGKLPFAGPDYIDTVNGHLSTPPPLPSDYVAGLPVEIESLILRCLEKEPDKRPESAKALADELKALREIAGDRVTPIRISAGADTVDPLHPVRRITPRSHPTLPSSPVRKVAPPSAAGKLGLAAAVLVTAALLGGAWWGSRGKPVESAAVPTLDLQIVSEPPGGEVRIDGQLQTLRTPALFHVPRAAALAVRIDKPGYRGYDEVVRVPESAREHALVAKLEPLAGVLRVKTAAREATWTVDGARAGTGSGTLELNALAPGPHTVRVEAHGFEPRQDTVQVQPGQPTALDWPLTAVSEPKKREPRAPKTALPDAPNTNFR